MQCSFNLNTLFNLNFEFLQVAENALSVMKREKDKLVRISDDR